jgi:transcriptional regulator with XRE-family HTH domain
MTEKELHAIFSENIKKCRGYYDWSQITLAKKAGISINFINDIESGKKWASPATMLKIANTLNVQVYELLKPPDSLPDNLSSIFRQYTANVHAAIENVNRTLLREVEKR